jgi:hypothetical protein
MIPIADTLVETGVVCCRLLKTVCRLQLCGEGCPVGMAGSHCRLGTAMQVVRRGVLRTGREMGVTE